MANITKEPRILTIENLKKIEELLGLDCIRTHNGSCIMTSKDGRVLVMYECETVFSKVKDDEVEE